MIRRSNSAGDEFRVQDRQESDLETPPDGITLSLGEGDRGRALAQGYGIIVVDDDNDFEGDPGQLQMMRPYQTTRHAKTFIFSSIGTGTSE